MTMFQVTSLRTLLAVTALGFCANALTDNLIDKYRLKGRGGSHQTFTLRKDLVTSQIGIDYKPMKPCFTCDGETPRVGSCLECRGSRQRPNGRSPAVTMQKGLGGYNGNLTDAEKQLYSEARVKITAERYLNNAEVFKLFGWEKQTQTNKKGETCWIQKKTGEVVFGEIPVDTRAYIKTDLASRFEQWRKPRSAVHDIPSIKMYTCRVLNGNKDQERKNGDGTKVDGDIINVTAANIETVNPVIYNCPKGYPLEYPICL